MDSQSTAGPMAAEIATAVDWWAKSLADIGRHTGDDTTDMLLMFLAVHSPSATPTQIDVFKTTLTGTLQALAASAVARGCDRLPTLGVDYGPDRELADAARAAGICGDQFPVKTMMWIAAGKVSVAQGYGAPTRVIYPAEEEGEQKPT